MPGEVHARFKILWAQGHTYAWISQELHVSERSLLKWRVELHLPKRGPGRKKL